MDLYILNGKTPVAIDDARYWSEWFNVTKNRRVALSEKDKFRISTVFLGIDHQWRRERKPLLFETMVFDNSNLIDKYCRRYSSWDEAEAGHYAVVALIGVERFRK